MATLGRALDARVLQELKAQGRRTAPAAVSFAFVGQISIWLISLLGNSHSVLRLAALGRLAMAYKVLPAVVSPLVVPFVVPRFSQVQGGLLALLGAIVFVVAAFPESPLLVLGDAGTLLVLLLIGTVAGVV
jgi:hypothetical protein